MTGPAGPPPEIAPARPDDLAAVLALLREAGLPGDGVAEHFAHFLVARGEGRVVGAVGLEPYGASALLRSLVVAPSERKRGLGLALARQAVEAARAGGARRLFLLTETAPDFFPRLGFARIPREEADAAVQASVEFRTACCQSAVCMRLDLRRPGLWQPELDELDRREAMAERLGGAERVRRQHAGGRLTIRERIARLVDPGSFHEVGKIAGRAAYDAQQDLTDLTPSNFVFGRARVDGRPVVVGGDDFTVRGGSADATIKGKHIQCERMAHDLRVPLIRLVEGSGGGGSVKTIETTGRANVPGVDGWEWVVENVATIPRVALGLGSVAGLGAAHLAAAHYSVMVKGLSALFVAGPPVVERLGQRLSKNELGGWEIQLRAGAVDDAVDTEDEAFARARRFLSYLPSSIHDLPPRGPQADPPARREDWLVDAVPRDPRKVYRMRPIVEAVVDQGSFFEIAPLYGGAVITGLARLDGWPVAVMAGDPFHYAGAWTADTCQKVERFVDLAQTFHLPVAYLVDCPGFLIGLEAEQTGTIKQGVRAMSAIWQTTVPWCAVIIRNVFGVAGAAHRNGGRYCFRYAWPSGRWGSLPLEGGIEAAYRADLDAAPDPAARLAEIEARLNKLRSPFRSAETFWIEEIIDPRDTRPLLCDFANLVAPLREPGPSRHGMRP